MTTARVRGIYTTAVTHLLREAGIEVVQPSDPIRERFDDSFEFDPADVAVETTADRRGVGVSGPAEASETVADELDSIAVDAFRWGSETPDGAVFDAEVEATRGGGAVVDLGDGRRGSLPFDAVDGYVDDGDRYRVQVHEPRPPWVDDPPLVDPAIEIRDGLCTLSRGQSGVSAAIRGERATELVGMTDLLSTAVPDGWGLRWERAAADADLSAMDAALERAADRVRDLEDALADAEDEPGENGSAGGEPGDPERLTAPKATTWLRFGRESRFALDDVRREVERTMVGHHRIKAAHGAASAAVDFAEAVCDSPGEGEFPFSAVAGQFGPTRGDRLELAHGKPDGRLFSLGTGEVTEWDPDGTVTVERSMSGGGRYDALGVEKEDGDVAVTRLREGRWWYPTTYRDAEGNAKGTYVNVCTPVELFPDAAEYVDLYVDVVRYPDGRVEAVDEVELAAAADEGLVSAALEEKARSVASAVERALSK